jgi:type I restriction enzyme, S subunit
LNVGTVRDFLIPVPPIHEQKRIVAILDEAFEGIDRAIANTEKNLTNTRELFESYLNEIFTKKGDGWEEKTLREVSSEFGRGKSKHRPRNDPKLYGGSYPFIQTGDVRNCNHFITQNSQFYSEIGLAQSKLWPKGTICITIAANIAETGILGFDACFPDSIIGIVVDDKITSNNFVEYLLQSVKARIKAKGQGSAQDNINLATFENERFPFPSLEQQKNLVSKLNKLSSETQHLESIYRQKIAALNELKQSILQKAFTGELTADHQTIETAEQDRPISKDCLRSTETIKQNVRLYRIPYANVHSKHFGAMWQG